MKTVPSSYSSLFLWGGGGVEGGGGWGEPSSVFLEIILFAIFLHNKTAILVKCSKFSIISRILVFT